MTQHRNFSPLDVFPAGFLDALQETLGAAHLSPSFHVVQTAPTQLSIPASSGDQQVSASIQGSWRFVTADVVATAPAGGAGTYNIWLTSRVLDTTQEDAGSFNYAFGLKLGSAPSGSGAEAISRIIGTYEWDGTKITGFATLGTRKFGFGTGTWFWPGGSSRDSETVVAHGLGATPIAAWGIPVGNPSVYYSDGFAAGVSFGGIEVRDATNMTLTARCGFAPSGGSTPFLWVAIA